MKAVIWCRHDGDNVIGIGPNIPWHIKSDFKRFHRVTAQHSIIVGQNTYETFPNRTLPDRKIYVLSFDKAYEVADQKNHRLINDVHYFAQLPDSEEVYISGGAGIYRLFLSDIDLAPDYIIDCCYLGEMNTDLVGERIDVTPCVEFMNNHYTTYEKSLIEDNVLVTLRLKKNTAHHLQTTIDLWRRIADNS